MERCGFKPRCNLLTAIIAGDRPIQQRRGSDWLWSFQLRILTFSLVLRCGRFGRASGVFAGAGWDTKLENLFGEVNESVRAYGVGGHRHVAEIEQELDLAGAGAVNPGIRGIDFLPHLVPMTRGILVAAHVRPTRPTSQAELDALFAGAYAGEPFVTVVATPPATKHVTGSNEARLHVSFDPRTGRILVLAVLDNLVKGAAGQAVQSFNLVQGLPETAGLEQLPLAP